MRSNPIGRLTLIALTVVALAAAGCAPAVVAEPTWTATAAPATALPSRTPTATPTTTPSVTPTPACRGEGGKIDETSYRSRLLNADIPLVVYTPPCYQQDSGRRYPSVYLLHGKPYDQTHWLSLGVVEAFEAGWRQGRWRSAVLVMPKLPEPLFSSTDGGPNSYEAELMDDAIPQVESRYRLQGEPGGLSLAGISRGGVWALEIGLSHSDSFAAVAALSPALAVNHPRPAFDPFTLIGSQPKGGAQFLLLAGEDDWAWPASARLADQMQAAGWPTQLQLAAGNHSDPTWQAVMADVLSFLLPSADG
jgi:enterochelin esterase-like enzyme